MLPCLLGARDILSRSVIHVHMHSPIYTRMRNNRAPGHVGPLPLLVPGGGHERPLGHRAPLPVEGVLPRHLQVRACVRVCPAVSSVCGVI